MFSYKKFACLGLWNAFSGQLFLLLLRNRMFIIVYCLLFGPVVLGQTDVDEDRSSFSWVC